MRLQNSHTLDEVPDQLSQEIPINPRFWLRQLRVLNPERASFWYINFSRILSSVDVKGWWTWFWLLVWPQGILVRAAPISRARLEILLQSVIGSQSRAHHNFRLFVALTQPNFTTVRGARQVDYISQIMDTNTKWLWPGAGVKAKEM